MTIRTIAAVFSLALACGSKAPAPDEPGTGGHPPRGTGGQAPASTGGTPGGTGGGPTTGSGGAGTGGVVGSTGGAPGTAGATGTGGAGSTGGSAGGDADGDAPAAEVGNPSAGTCAGVTAKFCSDWESLEAGMPPTGDFTISARGTGTVVVDTAQHFSGTKSLHFKSTGNGKVMLLFTKQFPFNDLHGRLMIQMPKKPATQAHWDFVQSHSGANNHWELGGMYGNFELVVDPPDNGIDSPTPFPEGNTWHCIQWNFKYPGDTFTAKLDGQLVKPSPVMGRWRAGPWKDLTVGWEIFGSGAADFFIDDLAFGEQEIPCPNK